MRCDGKRIHKSSNQWVPIIAGSVKRYLSYENVHCFLDLQKIVHRDRQALKSESRLQFQQTKKKLKKKTLVDIIQLP